MKAQVVVPGASLGVLGNGQLARMFAMKAQQMGYKVVVFAKDGDGPANHVAWRSICASYDDMEALADFVKQVAVVTLEFENIPLESVKLIEEIRPVKPSSFVLGITQHRHKEKTFLASHEFPVVKHELVSDFEDLREALKYIGLPAVLKTTTLGYDGKGQILIEADPNLEAFPLSFAGGGLLLEEFVEIDKELSVIGARSEDGQFVGFDVVENYHQKHILDLSFSPANISPSIASQAVAMTEAIMQKLNVVGLLCVEFFLTRDGQLLVNELAPRPHNSGHLTIEACDTSQFEQQVRSVTGLPLGDTTLIKPAAMTNLLGELWFRGEPDWSAVLAIPGIHLHLYGKADPRPGRKMGHLTALADSAQAAADLVCQARKRLSRLMLREIQ